MPKYEVQHLHANGEWINVWKAEDDVSPLTFDSLIEAEHELQTFITDCQAEVDAGHLQDFDPAQYRIVEVGSP